MANQEVVNAINETMVPNGVKAINADSVRNLLLLMAEKMGEGTGSGSGSGAVRVHIFDSDDLDFSQVNFEGGELGVFTPEEIELIENMTVKAQQDNKAAYKLIYEYATQGTACIVIGDATLFGIIVVVGTFRMLEAAYKEIMPDVEFDWSALTIDAIDAIDVRPMYVGASEIDTSGLDDNSLGLLIEILGDFTKTLELRDFLSPNGAYSLKEDGSVLYEGAPTEEAEQPYEPIIYLSGGENGMTDDMLEANKRAYLIGKEYIGVYWSVRENFSGDVTGSSYFEKGGCVHEIHADLSTTPVRKYFRFWKGTDMMQVTVDEDGTATLEVYASINPTT